MSKESLRWFGVRSVYRTQQSDTELVYSYEERVVVFLADSFESAIEMAAQESQEYVGGATEIALDHFTAFEIIDEHIRSGTEVYSLIRDSNLESDKYLNSFFDTGNERNGNQD